nr:MAG TPA: hypothetical protein [Caudoviricetes sp.]
MITNRAHIRPSSSPIFHNLRALAKTKAFNLSDQIRKSKIITILVEIWIMCVIINNVILSD